MDDLAGQFASQTLIDDGIASPSPSPSPQPGGGFFSIWPRPKRDSITKTIKKIRQPLTKNDNDPGVLYLAKESGTRMCKVGWSSKNNGSRIKCIAKCEIEVEKGHQSQLFDFS